MAKVTPNAAAKPTKADKKHKVKKADLPKHPLVGSKDPNVYPFAGVPADYDGSKFAPLSKDDFAKRSAFLNYRADQLAAKANSLRELAKTADEKNIAGGKVGKLKKMMGKANELIEELRKQGIDVDALIAATKPTPAAATK